MDTNQNQPGGSQSAQPSKEPLFSPEQLREVWEGTDDGKTPADRARDLLRQRNPREMLGHDKANLFFMGQKLMGNV